MFISRALPPSIKARFDHLPDGRTQESARDHRRKKRQTTEPSFTRQISRRHALPRLRNSNKSTICLRSERPAAVPAFRHIRASAARARLKSPHRTVAAVAKIHLRFVHPGSAAYPAHWQVRQRLHGFKIAHEKSLKRRSSLLWQRL